MKTLMMAAAVLAACGLVAGCFTSATAYTQTTGPDGSVTVSKVKIVGTGDKASQVAAEGLFADGTAEDLGAGVKSASASQQSTGIDGTFKGMGEMFHGMAAFLVASRGQTAAAVPAAVPAGSATALTHAPPADPVPRSAVSAEGAPVVAVLGNRATCSLCRTLWAGLDSDALAASLGASVIDADATANAGEYARLRPSGAFAYPLVRVFGASGNLISEFSGRGLSQAQLSAKIAPLLGG